MADCSRAPSQVGVFWIEIREFAQTLLPKGLIPVPQVPLITLNALGSLLVQALRSLEL